MLMTNYTRIVPIFFFILSLFSIAEGSVRVAFLDERPVKKIGTDEKFSPSHNLAMNLSIPIRLVKGESEGSLILLDSNNAKELEVNFNEKPEKLIKLQIFRVETVVVENKYMVPDPLIPISPGETFRLKDRQQLFYIKVTSLPSATAGKFLGNISFVNKNGEIESTIRMEIEVLPITIPKEMTITVQASINPLENTNSQDTDQIKQMLRLLSDYRINGVAGMQFVDINNYKELVRFALDDLNFHRVRLPTKTMYSWANPMSKKFPGGRPSESSFEKGTRQALSPYNSIIENPRWAGKLQYKIWDEPPVKDFPDVISTYKAARNAAPSLKLELSKQPDQKLQNVADIWITMPKLFNPADVEKQHRLGKEVWIYCNKIHGIDHPLFGMRILGWLIWRYNLDGYQFWAINWWKEDPWTTVSSQKKDFLKRGTFVYPDTETGKIYPSLRLESFREGIEDMLLLREIEKLANGSSPTASKARELLSKLRNVYEISERYDNATNPGKFRNEILNVLMKGVEK